MTGKTSKGLRSTIAVATIVAGLSLVGASSASSATLTWLNASVRPNGSWHSDSGTGASSYSRDGVTAEIPSASGYTWKTTASFNGYSSSGQAAATQNGPRGYGTTKAAFEFLPGTTANDRIGVKAWILNAVLGRSASSALIDAHSVEEVEPPASATITAEHLRAGDAPDLELTSYGMFGAAELWSGVSATGETCLFTLVDDYVGATCAEAEVFGELGLSIHSSSPASSLQAVLAPHGGITESSATNAGLERITDSLAVNIGDPQEGSLSVASHKRNSSGPTSIVLVTVPQE